MGQVMPAGGGDLERALRTLLALDVAQVEQRFVALMHLRLRARAEAAKAGKSGK
jgi:hypothetical protein